MGACASVSESARGNHDGETEAHTGSVCKGQRPSALTHRQLLELLDCDFREGVQLRIKRQIWQSPKTLFPANVVMARWFGSVGTGGHSDRARMNAPLSFAGNSADFDFFVLCGCTCQPYANKRRITRADNEAGDRQRKLVGVPFFFCARF